MNKTGIVVKIKRKYAYILTHNGEFAKVKIEGKTPIVGEIFTGKYSKERAPFNKLALTAAITLFILLSSFGTYSYCSAITSVIVNINPSINLKANMWNKVIEYIPLNNDGKILLNNMALKDINLKNKSIDISLSMLIEEAREDNFINKNYIPSGKTINISITSTKNTNIKLTKFKEVIRQNKIPTIINNKPIQKINNVLKIDTNKVIKLEHKHVNINRNNNIKLNKTKPIKNINSNNTRKNSKNNNINHNNSHKSNNNNMHQKNKHNAISNSNTYTKTNINGTENNQKEINSHNKISNNNITHRKIPNNSHNPHKKN